MNWTEYCALAARTESIPSNYFGAIGAGKLDWHTDQDKMKRATRLLHAAMGLVTETQELADSPNGINTIEEIGDCFWYLPIIQDVLGLNLSPELVAPTAIYSRTTDALKAMQHYAAELINYIGKRHLFYGKDLELHIIEDCVEQYVKALVDYCQCITSVEDWVGVGPFLKANITKLAKRYPDLTFNKEHAVVRNVQNELSHIHETLEDAQDAQLVIERQSGPTVSVLHSDYLFEQIEKENTEARLQGVAIGEDFFRSSVMRELHWNDVPITFAGWALMLSNEYREAGCDALAEGLKHTYIKLLAIKGVDLEAKATAVMKDGWALFQLMDVKPIYEGEFIAWLMSKRNKI